MNVKISRRRLLTAATGPGVALSACAVGGRPNEQAAVPSLAPVTLEHMDWWTVALSPLHDQYLNGVAKEIQEKYSNITINYTLAPLAQIREKWIVNSAAGTPADTSQVSVAFVRYLMEGGMVEPLDGYAAKTPHVAMSQFLESALFYNQYQGKAYGIPHDGPQTQTIAYNARHFGEVGLNPARDFTGKWTADQFLDAARRLTKKDGQAPRGGFQAPTAGSAANYTPWLYGFGGDFYAKDYKRVLFNEPRARAALQYLVDLRVKHDLLGPDGATFENEKFSMIVSGTWRYGIIAEQNPQLQFDFAPMPRGPQATAPNSHSFTNMWSMAKASTKKDAAWLYLSHVNSLSTMERWFGKVYKRLSARKDFYQSATWTQMTKEHPTLMDIEKMERGTKEYPWVKPDEFNRETQGTWRQVYAGTLGVNDALAQMEQIGNRLLGS